MPFIRRQYQGLRTPLIDGEPVQVVRAIERFELALADISLLGSEQQEAEIQRVRADRDQVTALLNSDVKEVVVSKEVVLNQSNPLVVMEKAG